MTSICGLDINSGIINAGLSLSFGLVFGLTYVIIEDFLGRITNPHHTGEKRNAEIKAILAGSIISAFLLSWLGTFGTSIGNAINDYNTTANGVANNLTSVAKSISSLLLYYNDLAPTAFSVQYSFIAKYGYSKGSTLAFVSDLENIYLSSLTQLLHAIFILYASSWFMCFSFVVAVKYLLPLAIVLRLMPPLKKLGSTLIAIVFGIAFIMPYAFLITLKVLNALYATVDINHSSISAFKNYVNDVKSVGMPMQTLFDAFIHPAMAIPYAVVNIGSEGWKAATAFASSWIGDLIYYGTVALVKAGFSIPGLSIQSSTESKARDLLNQGLEIGKVITDYTLTTFIKMSLLVFIASMVTLVSIRTISLLLGGEFFLYGIQEKI